MVAHELCHAGRWGKNDEWANSLFDGVVSKGIATYLEAEFIKDRTEKTVFIKTILERSDEENEKILEKLRSQLDSNYYDYDTNFFGGSNDLPRWSGYSLGYYLVRKYLKKTGKKIEDAFADKYADFKTIVLQMKKCGESRAFLWEIWFLLSSLDIVETLHPRFLTIS